METTEKSNPEELSNEPWPLSQLVEGEGGKKWEALLRGMFEHLQTYARPFITSAWLGHLKSINPRDAFIEFRGLKIFLKTNLGPGISSKYLSEKFQRSEAYQRYEVEYLRVPQTDYVFGIKKSVYGADGDHVELFKASEEFLRELEAEEVRNKT